MGYPLNNNDMQPTRVFLETLAAITDPTIRVIANRGGTRSGKTYSVTQLLVVLALQSQVPLAIDIVAESLPHLKRGALKDVTEVLDNEGCIEGQHYTYNRTDRIITIVKSKISFFGADDWGKVKGSRRDILFINEANRISFAVYQQLAARTTQKILIDWNPDTQFWFERRGISARESTREIVSTYKDNPHLTEQQVAEIESNKDDEQWWKVYGLGEVGNPIGVVYNNWRECERVPPQAQLIAYGLDFGFVADPTALVAVYKAEGELYLDELLYMPGLTNNLIAQRLLELKDKHTPIIADSAEMKSIVEIRNFGVRTISPAQKGADSIRAGIDILRRYRLNVTKRSFNLIDELSNYKYETDRITNENTGRPIDAFNHALDAVRYVALNKLAERRKGVNTRRIADHIR